MPGYFQDAFDGVPLEFLHRRPGQVEDQLIALQFQCAFGLADHPVGMFMEQDAVGIHHFRLHPDAETQSAFDGFSRQRRQTVRKALGDWAANRQARHRR